MTNKEIISLPQFDDRQACNVCGTKINHPHTHVKVNLETGSITDGEKCLL